VLLHGEIADRPPWVMCARCTSPCGTPGRGQWLRPWRTIALPGRAPSQNRLRRWRRCASRLSYWGGRGCSRSSCRRCNGECAGPHGNPCRANWPRPACRPKSRHVRLTRLRTGKSLSQNASAPQPKQRCRSGSCIVLGRINVRGGRAGRARRPLIASNRGIKFVDGPVKDAGIFQVYEMTALRQDQQPG